MQERVSMKVTQCRICQSKELKKIFSLGDQPLANNLPFGPIKNIQRYPLELLQCQHCSLIQLSYVVKKEKMFDEYYYIPSVSKTMLKHFKNVVKKIIEDFQLKEGSLVVDIGSSDGSLLKEFKKRNMEVLGIEPAKNITSSVYTIHKYFTPKLAKEMSKTWGKANVITATNVFAHIDNLHEFLEALDILLAEHGIFFAQFPDVRNLLKENQFDTIYHEHLSYFTFEPLHHLFANSPFELFRIDTTEVHGGSMQIFVRRRENLLETFKENVRDIKNDLQTCLLNYKKQGKKIVGFGAAAKGMVLLDYCKIDDQLLECVVDGTSYKQGKYTPGTNLPIVPESYLSKHKVDVVLILAWNHKEEIMEKLKGKDYTFIIPVPMLEVVCV